MGRSDVFVQEGGSFVVIKRGGDVQLIGAATNEPLPGMTSDPSDASRAPARPTP
jgi:hypothetical protein